MGLSRSQINNIMRGTIRIDLIIIITIIIISLLFALFQFVHNIRDILTATATVQIENRLDVMIVFEDTHKSRNLANIPAQSSWSMKLPLADYEDGRSITTFRIKVGDGRWAEIESNVFLNHRACIQEHGVNLRSLSGTAVGATTKTIEWKSGHNN